MSIDKNVIKFSFTVASVKTLADGGIRISLDLSEQSIPQAAMLMDCKRQMIPLIAHVEADTKSDIDSILEQP